MVAPPAEFGGEGGVFGNGEDSGDFRDVLPDTMTGYRPPDEQTPRGRVDAPTRRDGFDRGRNGSDGRRSGSDGRRRGPIDYTSGRDDVVIDQPDPYDWLNPPPDEPVGSDGPPDGLDWFGAGEGNGFDEGENGEPYGHVEPTQGTVYTGPQTEPPPRPQPYIPPPIERIIPGGGPSTGGPPAGGDPLATRAGTGVGSGFYGEQKWFDPNAPDPAKRDIGGFSPHELPRTSADFAAAGDTGGAGLLSRLNAPAAPGQNYLSPAPVPGAAEGGLVDIDQIPTDRLEELAKAAQQIESPGSQQIIERAIEDFGVEMVNQIVTMIQQQGPMMAPDGAVPGSGMDRGGLINGGGGDAMADDIFVNAEMGMNGERQKIAVSAGEYIVPGDVLAHLGSGNTEEGGEVMDQFIEDVRVQRTGSPEQPPPINLSDVLPSTYGGPYA